MKRILKVLLLTLYCSLIAMAQTEAQDAKSKTMLDKAKKNGNELQTQITVNGNVHAQAVLIPAVDARRIFGKEIAENYAVVEVNVGNKSPDAALIIHGIFIDYSQWPLSGATSADITAARSTDSYQASAFPNQVASEEYRVVRGQLLDAQTDTLRNRFMRWLTLAGNLAGAFTFSINEQGIVKGIAAATGVGVPGVATAWPDKIIEQLNRVSDFGFQANKVVSKQGSEVIVCFFPIDRFLTPGFRKLFLKSPASFFAPGLLLVDKSVEKEVNDIIKGVGLEPSELKKELPCYETVAHRRPNDPAYPICLDEFALKEDSTSGVLSVIVDSSTHKPRTDSLKKFEVFMAINFIGSVSLNRVTITVDGVMAVDVKAIAARIDEVDIDKVADCGDAGSQCFWTDVSAGGGVRKGVVHGAYMTDGTVAIAEATELSIDPVTTIKEGSNDQELHFSFKLNRPIPSQTKLYFTVTKPAPSADSQPLVSNSFEYLVPYSPSANGIESVTLSTDTTDSTKKILTVNGRGFDPATLVVTLHSEAGAEVKVPAASLTPAPTKSQFVIANVTGITDVKAGCWYVQVQSGVLSSNRSEKFAIAPKPTLTSAEHNDKFIFVKGNDLIDFSHCGGQQVRFQLQQGTATPKSVDVVDWNNGKPVLTLPEEAKTNSWKVQVLLNGTLVTTNGEVDLKPISQ